MYVKPPVTVSELFAPFPQEIKSIGKEIRNRIMNVIPEAEEHVYGGKKICNALYSLDGTKNIICGLQPHEKFVRVFFHNWERLKEAGYLIEGSGKHARHVKIESMSCLDNLDLKAMIDIVKK